MPLSSHLWLDIYSLFCLTKHTPSFLSQVASVAWGQQHFISSTLWALNQWSFTNPFQGHCPLARACSSTSSFIFICSLAKELARVEIARSLGASQVSAPWGKETSQLRELLQVDRGRESVSTRNHRNVRPWTLESLKLGCKFQLLHLLAVRLRAHSR